MELTENIGLIKYRLFLLQTDNSKGKYFKCVILSTRGQTKLNGERC